MQQHLVENENIESAGLPKVFSFHHYLSLSIGYAIGLGWIFVPARMLLRGGPMGILIAIVVSGLLLWCIAKCYAELVASKPATGGEIVYTQSAFGNGASFSVFWLLVLGYLSYVLFYTSFAGAIFESLAPALKSDVLYQVKDSEFRVSSIAPGLVIGAFVIGLNFISTRLAITVQSIATALLVVMVLIVAAVAFANGDTSNFKPFFAGDGGTLEAGQLVVVVSGMICWYLFGFSTIAQCAAEAKDEASRRKTGKAIILSLGLVTIFYLVVQSFVIVSMPWSDSAVLTMPTAEVLKLALGSDWAYKTILVAGLLGVITTLNACVICCVRSILAASRAGFLPHWFGAIHQATGAPRNAIVFVALFATAGPFLALAWLASDPGPISFLCAYLFTCAAVLRQRRRAVDGRGFARAWDVITIYLGIFAAAIMALSMFVPGAYYELKWPGGYLFLLGCAVVGFALYKGRLVHIGRQ